MTDPSNPSHSVLVELLKALQADWYGDHVTLADVVLWWAEERTNGNPEWLIGNKPNARATRLFNALNNASRVARLRRPLPPDRPL